MPVLASRASCVSSGKSAALVDVVEEVGVGDRRAALGDRRKQPDLLAGRVLVDDVAEPLDAIGERGELLGVDCGLWSRPRSRRLPSRSRCARSAWCRSDRAVVGLPCSPWRASLWSAGVEIRQARPDEIDAVVETVSTASTTIRCGVGRSPTKCAGAEQYRAVVGPFHRARSCVWMRVGDARVRVGVGVDPAGRGRAAAEELAEEPALLEEFLAASDAPRVVEMLRRFEAAHPHDEPHYYLSIVATHTASRGRGLGVALLAATVGADRRRTHARIPRVEQPRQRGAVRTLGLCRRGEFAVRETAPRRQRCGARTLINIGPGAGSKSPCSTSGSRSTPFGQRIVPDSGSTRTCAKYDGSASGRKTGPPSRRCARSTSRTSPSLKPSRSR